MALISNYQKIFSDLSHIHESNDFVAKFNGTLLFVTISAPLFFFAVLLMTLTVIENYELYFNNIDGGYLGNLLSWCVIQNILLAISTFFNHYFLANENTFLFRRLLLLSQFSTFIISLIFLIVNASILSYLIASVLSSVTANLALAVFTFRRFGFRITLRGLNLPLLKRIYDKQGYLFVVTIVNLLNVHMGRFLLGSSTGSVIASFSLSTLLYVSLYSISISISYVYLKDVHSLTRNEGSNNRIEKVVSNVGIIQLIVFFLFYFSLILFGQEIVLMLLGLGFEDVYFLTLILCTPMMILVVSNLGLEFLYAHNLHRTRAWLAIVSFSTSIFTSIVLMCILKNDTYAVAFGLSFSNILFQFLYLNRLCHKKFGIFGRNFWQSMSVLVKPLFISFLIGWILKILFMNFEFVGLVTSLLLFVIVYILLLRKAFLNATKMQMFE
jgi:O-antigen/teichoic acid export membrane protein